MVFDDEHPTDWFAFNVNGENADSVSMEKAKDGIVLEADNFQNVKVQANNRNYAAEVTFSTKDHSNVLVYEIDAYTIGISADNDGNGTYETLIAQSDNGVEGDINNDGKFNIADLVSFQQWLLSDGTTLTNWKLADMCNDNVLNVFDLCEMKARLTTK